MNGNLDQIIALSLDPTDAKLAAYGTSKEDNNGFVFVVDTLTGNYTSKTALIYNSSPVNNLNLAMDPSSG